MSDENSNPEPPKVELITLFSAQLNPQTSELSFPSMSRESVLEHFNEAAMAGRSMWCNIDHYKAGVALLISLAQQTQEQLQNRAIERAKEIMAEAGIVSSFVDETDKSRAN